MRSVSSTRAVTMMIGTDEVSRIRRVTSRPSMPGRPRSRTIMSGLCDRAIEIAVCPSVASMTEKPAPSR